MFLLLVEMNSLMVGVTHRAGECLEIDRDCSALFSSSSRGSYAAYAPESMTMILAGVQMERKVSRQTYWMQDFHVGICTYVHTCDRL